jgi:hypothetical protein
MHQADVLFSKVVRSRGYCESDRPNHSGNLQCAHIISRSYKAVRTDESNGLCLCQGCHMYFTHHPLEFEIWVSTKWPARWETIRGQALMYDRIDWKFEVERLNQMLRSVVS